MFRLLVCLVLAVVLSRAQEPKKCCMPEQFTAMKGVTIGTNMEGLGPMAVSENHDAAFDFKNNRTSAFVTRYTYDGQPPSTYRLVVDFNQKAQWVIVPSSKKCDKESIDGNAFGCIPADATFAGTFYFADKALNVNSWYFTVKDYQLSSGQVSITVVPSSNGTCIPVGETFMGTSTGGGVSQSLVSTSGYLNYTKGISDPDRYFTLPDYCTGKLGKVTKL